MEVSYDFFVGASGLRRAWPVVPQSLRKDDYLGEALRHINAVERADDGVVVIGGGMEFSFLFIRALPNFDF